MKELNAQLSDIGIACLQHTHSSHPFLALAQCKNRHKFMTLYRNCYYSHKIESAKHAAGGIVLGRRNLPVPSLWVSEALFDYLHLQTNNSVGGNQSNCSFKGIASLCSPATTSQNSTRNTVLKENESICCYFRKRLRKMEGKVLLLTWVVQLVSYACN